MMGTRLWYAMWDAEQDDDAAFERRVGQMLREVGDRGKPQLAEAVTPFREPRPVPTPSPTPAPAPLPATRPTDAPATALSSSTTPALVRQQPGPEPSMPSGPPLGERQPMVTQQLSSSTGFAMSAAGASLMEVSAFMTEQLRTQIAEQRVHDEAQRQKWRHS